MSDVRELTAAPSGGYRAAALGLVRRSRPTELPKTTLVLRGVQVDLERLAGYDRVCGYRLADQLPATYPHVLAFPLAMHLMAGRDFPFPVIGLVHVANRIEQLRPIGSGERLHLAVSAENLRPHPRGQQFDVLATATVDDEVVWRGVSTYLRRSASSGAVAAASVSSGAVAAGTATDEPESAGAGERAVPPAPSARWRVERAVGREYAAVSGDRNPIHTSRLGARAFGFARPIAHGMWSKARCLAGLEGRLPGAYAVDVAFKLPILLPATVAFAATATPDSGWEFALHDARSGKPHLAGTVTPG